MAWLRRDDQTPPEGEQEWISDLLDPLHGHGDNAEGTTEVADETAAGTAKSGANEPVGGTPRRSVADVIAQSDLPPRTPRGGQAVTDEPAVEQPARVDTRSTANEADRAATRSAADVLAAANRTGEATDSSDAGLPAHYAARVPTTGDIPSVDDTDTQIAATLTQIMLIEGALGTALVDYASGETIESRSTGGAPDMALSAAAESAVVRTKIGSLVQLDSDDDLDEVVTTLGTQHHLTRMVRATAMSGQFLYLVLDRKLASLVMARHKLALAASQLEA